MNQFGKTVAVICKQHGFQRGEFCSKCEEAGKVQAFGVHDESWVSGWWNDIDKDPIYIQDRKHLIHECEKRGVYPKALLKRKSQARGWEVRK